MKVRRRWGIDYLPAATHHHRGDLLSPLLILPSPLPSPGTNASERVILFWNAKHLNVIKFIRLWWSKEGAQGRWFWAPETNVRIALEELLQGKIARMIGFRCSRALCKFLPSFPFQQISKLSVALDISIVFTTHIVESFLSFVERW